MKRKNTSQLQKGLRTTANLNRFLKTNLDQFVCTDFSEMLQHLFQQSGLSKSALAKQADTSEVYLYQLFSGVRTPSRDRVICLCFGLSATLEQTQTLLKHSGHAKLYTKNRRDAIVIYGLTHQMQLPEINDLLYTEKETTLC